MKKKLFACLLMLTMFVCLGVPQTVRADGQRVVTMGADLNDDQRNMILRYFGISNDQDVQFLTITNRDEHEHLDSFVPMEQIGTRTISCAYVNPTRQGGIRVKTANLTWVTSNMIATTLSTAGIKNCDVIAAAPFKVSGTGALTGVIMAYEAASGEELDEVKKNLATLELIITGKLADRVGQAEATEIVNDIKIRIIREGITDEKQIAAIVEEVLNELDRRAAEREDKEESEEEAVELELPEIPVEAEEAVDEGVVLDEMAAEAAEDEPEPEALGNAMDLSDEEKDMLTDLALQIAGQDYEYEDMKDTLERVDENVKGQEGIVAEQAEDSEEEIIAQELELPDEAVDADEAGAEVIAGEAEEDSILDFTDDTALGEDALLDSTNKEDNQITEAIEEVPQDSDDGFEVFLMDEDEEEADLPLPEEDIQAVELQPEDDFLELPEEAAEDEPEEEILGEPEEIEEPEEEIPEEPVEEPVDDNMAEEPEEVIEPAEEEIPVEAAEEEPEIQTVAAVIEANPAVKGMIRIYVDAEDAVPVSGTVKVGKEGGKAWSKVDMSDPSLVMTAPNDGLVPDSVDIYSGTVITVLTEMETSNKKFFGADKEITADFQIESQGELLQVTASAAVPASEVGVVLLPAGSESLLVGSLNAEVWRSSKKGSVLIISDDPSMAAADRTEIPLKEEDHSLTLYFLQAGTAAFDFTFVTKDGEIVGDASLLVSVPYVPDRSEEEISQILSMTEEGYLDEAGEIEEIEEAEEIEEVDQEE